MLDKSFKPSDLGVIPNDWKRVKFGEITKVRQGLQIAISDRLTKPTPTSLEYITIQSINKANQDREYVESPSNRVTCQKHDVLMTRTGNTGIVVTGVEGAFHNNFFLIDYRRNQIVTDFLVNYLRSRRVQHVLFTKAGASTIPDLNHRDFYSIEFPLAPLPEQQKIAQILSTWDKAIENLEALIAAKQKRKKALMQQLLTGKKRFAGFEEEWNEVELGKLFKEVKDKVGVEQVIPHSITAGTGFVSHEEKWGKDISGSQYENYTLLRKGQFSYNKGNSKKYACGCMYLLKHLDEIAVPNVFISFERRNETVCNEFYEQYFMADYCARELRKHITSGARSDGLLNLNKADFFSIKIPLPDFNEQQKIAQILSAADTEIETHQKQLAALKQQKKGLMQQLLTGKKRVKDMAHD